METPAVFGIYRGNKKTMSLKARMGSCSGDPLDLTDCTEIDIALPNADGSFTHLLKSEDSVEIASPAVLGKFSALIDEEVSELLNLGELQTFDVTFTIGDDVLTVPYVQALSVFEHG